MQKVHFEPRPLIVRHTKTHLLPDSFQSKKTPGCLAISPNIVGAIRPRGGAGFGGQPANPGAFIPPEKEIDETIETVVDSVNMAGILYFDASRCSSLYSGSIMQTNAIQCLPCIRF